MSDHPTPSDADLARVAADKLGLRLPACDDGVVRFVLVNCLVALERARVVGVLDAWAADRERDEGPETASHTTNRPTNSNNGEWVCHLYSGYEGDEDIRPFYGATPDAARAAAAKAIEAGEV